MTEIAATETDAPNETTPELEPASEAGAPPMGAEQIIAFAHDYVARAGKGVRKGDVARVMQALVDAAAGASFEQPAEVLPTPIEQPTSVADVDPGPGNFDAITRLVVAGPDGNSVHLASAANRDYTRREAAALALDILRKIHAIA